MKKALYALAALAVAAVAAASAGVAHAVDRAGTVMYYHVALFGYGLRTMAGEWFEAFQYRTGALHYAFQSAVAANIGFGVIGEMAFDGPRRAQPAIISHGTAADIVIGRWFTLAADGTARPGGVGAIGGVFALPKNMASGGVAGNALAATLTVPTGTVGEFVYMGAIIVSLAGAVALGDVAKYNTTTGVIGTGAPGAGEAAVPNGKFIRVINAAAGLAVLELTN